MFCRGEELKERMWTCGPSAAAVFIAIIYLFAHSSLQRVARRHVGEFNQLHCVAVLCSTADRLSQQHQIQGVLTQHNSFVTVRGAEGSCSEGENIRPGCKAFTLPAHSPCSRPRGESLGGCGAARLYTNTPTCLRPRCSLRLSDVDETAKTADD